MGSDADTDLVLLDVARRRPLVPTAGQRPPPRSASPWSRSRRRRATLRYNAIDIVSRLNLLVTTSTSAMLAGLLGAELNTTPETSGGGLFNTNGELVGILTSPPGVTTTGLAVPIRIADDVRDQIESSGKVTHGWLGLTADDASDRAGATVTAVVPGQPGRRRQARGRRRDHPGRWPIRRQLRRPHRRMATAPPRRLDRHRLPPGPLQPAMSGDGHAHGPAAGGSLPRSQPSPHRARTS